MTWWDDGLVGAKLPEAHPDMPAVQRAVFKAMANVADRRELPQYFGNIDSLAYRTGFGRSTVKRALTDLERMGAIKRAPIGDRRDKVVRWDLPLLAKLRLGSGADHKDEQGTACGPERTTPGPERTTSDGSRADHNPSDPSVAHAEEGEEDQAAAGAAPSACAPGSAATPATSAAAASPRAQLLAELGRTEAWAERKLAAASTHVRNEPAFLRTCAIAEDEQVSANKNNSQSNGSAKPARAKPSPTSAPAKPKRKSAKGKKSSTSTGTHTPADRQRHAQRVIDGKLTSFELAKKLGVSSGTVQNWVTAAKKRATATTANNNARATTTRAQAVEYLAAPERVRVVTECKRLGPNYDSVLAERHNLHVSTVLRYRAHADDVIRLILRTTGDINTTSARIGSNLNEIKRWFPNWLELTKGTV